MIVILNRAAGNSAKSSEESDEKIRALFAQAGAEASIHHPDENQDLAAIARAAVDGPEELIVAGGGDGTISAVAGVLAGTQKILGVLPRGTLNHFAKDLGLPLDLPAAVQTILHGRIAEVDVGEMNDRVFINNSSLGIYPEIVAQREAQQERFGRGKWPAFVWATLTALHRFPFLNLRITIEGKSISRRSAFLFIGNNAYEIAGFKIGERKSLQTGRLGLYLARRTGRFGLFRLAFNALLGRLHQAKDFESFTVREATIETHKSKMLVAMDGEVTELRTPLHYRIRTRALRVMRPRESSV
ncbi:MAG: diacylglycerol/lipid kinase family protein [Chthoniobacterales bacterium]